MKCYDKKIYSIYKSDLSGFKDTYYGANVLDYIDDREKIVKRFYHLPEAIARGFYLSERSCGVMSINDLIQEGMIGLCQGVDAIHVDKVVESTNPDISVEAFLRIRIHGAIRRGVDTSRGAMRIPERKIREIRKKGDEDYKMAQMFFNSIFGRLTDLNISESSIPDRTNEYNNAFLSSYILGLVNKYLDANEAKYVKDVYGLDKDKRDRFVVARELGINSDVMKSINDLHLSALNKLSTFVDGELIKNYMDNK